MMAGPLPEDAEIAKIFENARLRNSDIDSASVKWHSDRRAVLSGILEETPDAGAGAPVSARGLQARFTNLRRLQHEYQQLKAHHDAPDDGRVYLYAVDPHILRVYSDAWDDSILNGFDFLHGEWTKGEKGNNDRRWYLLSLLSAIFQSQKLGLTSAAREAIIQALTYFTEAQDRSNRKIIDRIQVYEDLLDRLGKFVDASQDAPQKLETYFSHLTAASTFQPAFPDVQIARMTQLLKGDAFLNVRSIIAQSELPNEIRTRALALFDIAMRSPEATAECQVRLDRAFRRFLESTEVPLKVKDWEPLLTDFSEAKKELGRQDQPEDPSFNKLKHRNTEHLQRRAMLELHIANLCLEAVGANAEIRYLTFSTRLFEFLSNLSKSLRVPLVHPRFLFAYRSVEFYSQIKGGVDSILTAFSGSLKVIERDRKITYAEIEQVERFNTYLQPLRDTSAFAAVQQKAFTISMIIDGIREAVSQLDKYSRAISEESESDRIKTLSSRITDKLNEFKQMLDEGASKSAEIFSRYSTDAAAGDIYSLFRDLTKEIETKNQPRILARLVTADSDKPIRMICVPVTGAYRYMFSITNTDVLENANIQSEFTENLAVFELERFTQILEKAVEVGDIESNKNSAMLCYIRSFHAASYRDWSLADLLAKRGLEEIENVIESKRGARFFLLKHELLFLRHLTARGLAERQSSGRAQSRAAVRSMGLLQDSAKCIEAAFKSRDGNENFLGGGPFLGAMTFRLALSFAAAIIELLIAQKQAVDRGQVNLDIEDILVFNSNSIESEEKKFAWQVADFGNISTRSVWNDPRTACDNLSRGLLTLFHKIKTSLSEADGKLNKGEFDELLWKYRQLRCDQVIHLLALLIERKQIFGVIGDDLAGHIETSNFCDLVAEFRNRTGAIISKDGLVGVDEFTPFATVICSYFSWKKKEGDESLSSLAERLKTFEGVRSASSNLDPLGLPNRISNGILADWSEVLAKDLEWSTEFVKTFGNVVEHYSF